MNIEHCLGEDNMEEDTDTADRSKTMRSEFFRELEAMMRLRSPYTVNVYGIITTRKDRLVLVMELLTGGDLSSLLRSSREHLPEERVRLITMDVCAGIVFLHSKATVHGDLKSPNVLFDGTGRAKVVTTSVDVNDAITSRGSDTSVEQDFRILWGESAWTL